MENSMPETNYTTAQDHKDMIRADLTGGPFPRHVAGKIPNPIFDQMEEEYLNDKVRKELTAEGFSEGSDGVWAKD